MTEERERPEGEDPWMATLRRAREAAQTLRERLSEETERPEALPGIPCE